MNDTKVMLLSTYRAELLKKELDKGVRHGYETAFMSVLRTLPTDTTAYKQFRKWFHDYYAEQHDTDEIGDNI